MLKYVANVPVSDAAVGFIFADEANQASYLVAYISSGFGYTWCVQTLGGDALNPVEMCDDFVKWVEVYEYDLVLDENDREASEASEANIASALAVLVLFLKHLGYSGNAK